MKRRIGAICLTFLTLIATYERSFAWADAGHQMVAEVAFSYLDQDVQQKILADLQGYSIEKAATWMDDVKGKTSYTYMKSWHFVNIPKGKSYQQHNDDAVFQLNRVITALQNRSSLPPDSVKRYLCILFHLIGDLHQPLHTGYAKDQGGNKILVTLPDSSQAKLHLVWDYNILANKHITTADCIQANKSYTPADIASIQKLDLVSWMWQSRLLLKSNVYQFQQNTISQAYIDTSAQVIEKQIGLAGLRLAGILNQLYK